MASSGSTRRIRDHPTTDERNPLPFSRHLRSLSRRLGNGDRNWLRAGKDSPGERCAAAWETGAIVVFDVGAGLHCRLLDDDAQARHYAGPRKGWVDVRGPTTRDAIEYYGRTHDWKTVSLTDSQFDDTADARNTE